MGNPLGSIVETSLIVKLKKLAGQLVAGDPDVPRWIFLVGGPGNGKSEAIDSFIRELDELSCAQSELIDIARESFVAGELTPRRVDIPLQASRNTELAKNIRALVVIQDASAVNGPGAKAEEELVDDLLDLATSPVGKEPVFICCANRGLVARARTALQTLERYEWARESDIAQLLSRLLTATGLGTSSLSIDRPSCWPIELVNSGLDKKFAAWPLDLDSIAAVDSGEPPIERMIAEAASEVHWGSNSECFDCSSQSMCPFFENARQLRESDVRKNLLRLIRHGELASGQRWNFRDAFSLCAELIIGQRSDFSDGANRIDPCDWVHQQVDNVHGDSASERVFATWSLSLRLYSIALFPNWPDLGEGFRKKDFANSATTSRVIELFSERQLDKGAHVRNFLSTDFSRHLDPALTTPASSHELLRSIEDEFSQSIKQGSAQFNAQLGLIIGELLKAMEASEEEWLEQYHFTRSARNAVETLRVLSSTIVKRFLGVKLGHYKNKDLLVDYEKVCNDRWRLQELIEPLRTVLAPDDRFDGSLVRVFGQPPLDSKRDVSVTHNLGAIVPREAPSTKDEKPGHDLPWIEIRRHRLPLTFDLFEALQAMSHGATFSNFAPHTRAAVDKVKNSIAAQMSRDRQSIHGGETTIRIGSIGRLTPSPDGVFSFKRDEVPRFR